MKDIETRYADSTKQPLICSQHFMPGTHNPVLLAEYEPDLYIYLWCRIGRHVQAFRLRDLIEQQAKSPIVIAR